MTLRRLFVDAPLSELGVEIPLDQEELHYAIHVLRLKDQSEVEVFNNINQVANAVLKLAKKQGFVWIQFLQPMSHYKNTQLTLAMPFIKGPRMEWLIEKLVELGVTKLIPLDTEYAQLYQCNEEKLNRYRRLAVSAIRQSQGSQIPLVIESIQSMKSLNLKGCIYCHPENAVSCLSSTINTHLTSLQQLNQPPLILIGPEGGFAPQELQYLKNQDALPVHLGWDRILRAETAALLICGLVRLYQEAL